MPSRPRTERSERCPASALAFGRSIRGIRGERGWTLELASEKMGLELRHLQKIESGRVSPTLGTILKIADGLGTPAAALVAVAEGRRDYGRPDEPTPTDEHRSRAAPSKPGTLPSRPRTRANPVGVDPDATLRDVGRRVAELRATTGTTQADLALRMRASVKYVQRVESGRQNVTLRTLVRVANALGVPVGALLVPMAEGTAKP